MAKDKKTVRKELRLSQKAWDCANEQSAKTSRSFNNYIEYLILQNCKK